MPVFARSVSVIMDRYRCPICQDLLIEPVSVTCGHTFCRLCLARWTLQCKQTRCAQCQKFWTGQPHVNIVLRETIEELFPSQYDDRAEQHKEEVAVVDHFDKSIRAMLEKQQQQIQQAQNNVARVANQNQNNTNAAFFLGVGLAVVGAIVIFLLGFGPAETYVTKPVGSWSLLDCMQWLESMGDWTKDQMIPKFATLHLDGKYLMELAKDDSSMNLDEILSNETEENQQSLQHALKYISSEGRVPPGDLWEYKNVYPLKTLVLMELIFSFPRLGTLLMFIFDYSGSFLPVIHCVTGDMNISMYDTELPSPTNWQYVNFLTRLSIFPLFTVYTKFLFVALWATNHWATLYTCFRACVACNYDITTVLVVLQDQRAGLQLVKTLKAAFITGNVTYFALYIASWIVPRTLMNLVCSCFFYFNFIVLPLKDAIICLPLFYKFFNHWRSSSKAELWAETKELAASVGPVLQSLLQYTRHQLLPECKQYIVNIYDVVSGLGKDIYYYLRYESVDDFWALLKAIHGYTVRICLYIDHYTFRQFENNDAQQ